MFIYLILIACINALDICNQPSLSLECNATNVIQDCSSISYKNLTITCPNNYTQKLNLIFEGNITIENFNNSVNDLILEANYITINNIVSEVEQENKYIGAETNWLIIQSNNTLNLSNISTPGISLAFVSKTLNLQEGSQILASQIAMFIFNTVVYKNINIFLNYGSCDSMLQPIEEKNEQNISQTKIKKRIKSYMDHTNTDPTINLTESLFCLMGSNYTSIFIILQDFNLISSSIQSSQIMIMARNFSIDSKSIVNSSYQGCLNNQGKGRGPNFYSDQLQCQGNGGSNGGYGGIGLFFNQKKMKQSSDDPSNNSVFDNKCMTLTNATRYVFQLYPYSDFQQGSGGSSYNQKNTNYYFGSSGGAISLIISNNLTINGLLIADGFNGVKFKYVLNGQASSQYSGGGSGGTIWMNYNYLKGQGNITALGGNSSDGYTAGEGAGGQIILLPQNPLLPNNTIFTGEISVEKGWRQQIYNPQFEGQNGRFKQPLCPPFTQFNGTTSTCTRCPKHQYNYFWVGVCQPCPGNGNNNSIHDDRNDEQDENNQICGDYQKCITTNCETWEAILNKSITSMLLIVILLNQIY